MSQPDHIPTADELGAALHRSADSIPFGNMTCAPPGSYPVLGGGGVRTSANPPLTSPHWAAGRLAFKTKPVGVTDDHKHDDQATAV